MILCLRESVSPHKVSCSFFNDISLAVVALCLSDKSEYLVWSSNSFSIVSLCLVESHKHLASRHCPIYCQTNSVIDASWSWVIWVLLPMTGVKSVLAPSSDPSTTGM